MRYQLRPCVQTGVRDVFKQSGSRGVVILLLIQRHESILDCGYWRKKALTGVRERGKHTAWLGCWLASPLAVLCLEGGRGSGPCSRWAGYSQPMFNILGGSEAMPALFSEYCFGDRATRLVQ